MDPYNVCEIAERVTITPELLPKFSQDIIKKKCFKKKSKLNNPYNYISFALFC